jgi:hypothetical protein
MADATVSSNTPASQPTPGAAADAGAAVPAAVVSLAEARTPTPRKARQPRRMGLRKVAVHGQEIEANDIKSDLREISSGLSILAELLHQRDERQASDLVVVLQRSLDHAVEQLGALLDQPEPAA